jgi:hypothetical protein
MNQQNQMIILTMKYLRVTSPWVMAHFGQLQRYNDRFCLVGYTRDMQKIQHGGCHG